MWVTKQLGRYNAYAGEKRKKRYRSEPKWNCRTELVRFNCVYRYTPMIDRWVDQCVDPTSFSLYHPISHFWNVVDLGEVVDSSSTSGSTSRLIVVKILEGDMMWEYISPHSLYTLLCNSGAGLQKQILLNCFYKYENTICFHAATLGSHFIKKTSPSPESPCRLSRYFP